MKKILCFGDICPDLLIPYGAAHIAGSRPSDTRVRFSHGGSAANTASGLGRLGIPVLFAGSAGEDGFGRALRRGLEEDGVDTRCLKLYPELMTMEVLIVVDAQGERTPFAFPQTGPASTTFCRNRCRKPFWKKRAGFMLPASPCGRIRRQRLSWP